MGNGFFAIIQYMKSELLSYVLYILAVILHRKESILQCCPSLYQT
jgi:hypothetical protein